MVLLTTAIWGCSGTDTSELSYRLAQAEAEKGKTLVAELPCLGIPRLGFASNIMDRVRNVETFIMKIEQNQPLTWQQVFEVNQNLSVLPASVFATPDCPIVSKVSLSTLIDVAPRLINFAENEQCRHLILDCQGQLTSPMTFFALKAAGNIVIPVAKPTDAAYVLANIRRLVKVFKHPVEKFILLVEGDVKAIKRLAVIKGEDGKPLEGIKVLAWDKQPLEQIFDNEEALSMVNSDYLNEARLRNNLWSFDKLRLRRRQMAESVGQEPILTQYQL